MRTRLVVLASGSGTNLQAILDACVAEIPETSLAADVVAVVSDRPDAYALTRARERGVAAIALPRQSGEARADYDTRLAAAVIGHTPDYVVLAGWMRILTMKFLGAFPNRVVNLHPARPGELPGVDAIGRAYAEFQQGTRTSTGVMIHLVPDEGVNDGPVLATTDVVIEPCDTLADLESRVHAAERRLLVATLQQLTSAPSLSPTPTLDERSSP